MKVGILKETNDKRVAMAPETIKKSSYEILVESGAGVSAHYSDADYEAVAKVVSRSEVISDADILITVNPIPSEELSTIRPNTLLIALFEPYNNADAVPALQKYHLRGVSMDMIPRSSLAQSMDVLSSMASIAGYKAVLKAADTLPRYFPMMITAAGSIRPCTVLVLGAGVAGLQAIATAKRLGAMVEAFDVRSAVKEEVQSLGAKFIEVEGAVDDKDAGGYAVQQSEDYLRRQREEVANRAAKADVVITTAQLRGRKAPILLTAETVERMKAGSVIIDLASSTGGNCELSQDNASINHKGVTIIGNSNLAQEMPQNASLLYGNNVLNLLKLMIDDETKALSFEHEIASAALITPLATETND